jgi:NADH-quinone oxidoreductase E subunit
MSSAEETRLYKIEPRLGEKIGGTLRQGGANPPGSVGEEIAFKVKAVDEKVEFAPEVLKEIEEIVARYPDRKASLLPILWITQREYGYISLQAMEYVADLIDVPPSQVYSVVSFYTMYKPKPLGRYVIQICTGISCSLRGVDGLVWILKERLGVELGGTTPDGIFTLQGVECLALCDKAPCLQVNDENYENLSEADVLSLLDRLEKEAKGAAGSVESPAGSDG